MKKLLAVGVIVLFLGLAFAPSTGIIVSNDDTTPPVSSHAIDPPTPTGDNGWYVHDVEVTLDATDNMSGVKEIRYRIGGGSWQAIPGDHGTFVIDEDGDDILIEYYAVDNAGNEEEVKSFVIKMGQTVPDIGFYYKDDVGIKIKFIAIVSDEMSGVDRVEFYLCDKLNFTDYEAPYEWILNWTGNLWVDAIAYDKAGNRIGDYFEPCPAWYVSGLIFNPQFCEENVTFFALVVWHSSIWWLPWYNRGVYKFKQLTFRNDYSGYIGRFFIDVAFYKF